MERNSENKVGRGMKIGKQKFLYKRTHPQLLSLVAQTFKDWKCIIHDDGSADRTVEIIKDVVPCDQLILHRVDFA